MTIFRVVQHGPNRQYTWDYNYPETANNTYNARCKIVKKENLHEIRKITLEKYNGKKFDLIKSFKPDFEKDLTTSIKNMICI